MRLCSSKFQLRFFPAKGLAHFCSSCTLRKLTHFNCCLAYFYLACIFREAYVCPISVNAGVACNGVALATRRGSLNREQTASQRNETADLETASLIISSVIKMYEHVDLIRRKCATGSDVV